MRILRSSFALLIVVVLIFVNVSCSYKKKITATNIQLDPIYGSNMVFKRGDSIKIKGVCSSGSVLAVKLQDGLKYVNSDEEGKWEAKFPPFDYKGNFTIKLEGVDQTIELDNLTTGKIWVVIGDNWLMDTHEHISKKTMVEGRGANDRVRIYSPPSLYSNVGSDKTVWKTLKTDKKNYRELFSCFLGDELAILNEEPIGIINLSSPGTSLRDFIENERELLTSTFSKPEIDSIYSEYFSNQDKYQQIADSSFKGLERDVLDRFYDDWEWSDVEFPLVTRKRWYLKNRVVWLRKKVFIPEKYITSDFTIELGTIRGQFNFYFNGTPIANFKGESLDYKVHIPDTLIKVWRNLLTVRMVAGDSLSGFYSSTPRVINADTSYRMQIAEDWTIRTYYEPMLPKIKRNNLLWPQVYSNYVLPIEGFKVNSILLAGSIHQYSNLSDSMLTEVLKQMGKSFKSPKNYMFLIPLPSYVDGLVNEQYYNRIRNNQMISAAEENWELINTMGVTPSVSNQMYQYEMVEKLINKLSDE